MSDDVQVNAETPYSMENLEWLLDNSSARVFLGKETYLRMVGAMSSGDEQYLRNIFPTVLAEYLRERDIRIRFAVQSSMLMDSFDTNVVETGKTIRQARVKNKEATENEEKVWADQIIQQI